MNKKALFALLGAAIVALLAVRFLLGSNSGEVVVEESTETMEVRQMMNEMLQQQQQQGGPSGVPGP